MSTDSNIHQDDVEKSMRQALGAHVMQSHAIIRNRMKELEAQWNAGVREHEDVKRRARLIEKEFQRLNDEYLLNLTDEKQNEPEVPPSLLDVAYTERMIAVRMLAVTSGCKFGVGADDSKDKDDEWRNVVYVDLPEGQVSWHIAPHDVHLFADFPYYRGAWDGTFNGKDPDFAKRVKARALHQPKAPVTEPKAMPGPAAEPEKEPTSSPETEVRTFSFPKSKFEEMLLELAKTELAVEMDEAEQEYQVLFDKVEHRAHGDKLVHIMIRKDTHVYGE